MILVRNSNLFPTVVETGKTTTVSLITHILSARFDVVACGNIGYSVCRALVEHPNADIYVVELSSFQLESAQIDLNISVLLNAHPCHLDHHREYKRYLESKSNICKNQSASHYCVYHLDDPMVRDMVKLTGAKRISFSRTSYLAKSYLYKNSLYYDKKRILQSKESKIFMQENQLAAIAVASLIKGMCPRIIRKQIENFEEIEYRLTKVNDFIYNDAKSTNPYATIAALDCLENVELICGGYDRKENLSCLQNSLSKIKRVYAYGDTKYKIKEYMDSHHVECICFESLEEAFQKAYQDRTDEIILFSPMFASFDSFKNYIERGKYFNALARKVAE